MGALQDLKDRKGRSDKLTYKQRNGTTRVGDFLRGVKDVAPEILALAGSVTGIPQLELLGDAIRGDKGMSDLNKQLALKELEKDMVEMQELTKRLVSDNEHSITRLVRPVTYAFILLNVGIVVYFDGNVGTFHMDEAWRPLLIDLAKVMTYFYFGSRGAEKIVKEVRKF